MKKVIIGFIFGILVSGIVVSAGSIFSADRISYNDITVKDSIDNLFNDVENGKIKIAEAITNKGVETLETDSYDTIASNIDSISTADPYLRYNDENKAVQALNEDNEWVNVYYTTQLPLASSFNFLYTAASDWNSTDTFEYGSTIGKTGTSATGDLTLTYGKPVEIKSQTAKLTFSCVFKAFYNWSTYTTNGYLEMRTADGNWTIIKQYSKSASTATWATISASEVISLQNYYGSNVYFRFRISGGYNYQITITKMIINFS